MDRSVLDRVEAQLAELEANIARLKKALHHWQTLELDYEGLREEFHLLPEDSSTETCLQTARDFKPVLVDDKDLQSLLKDAKASSRTPQQLAHLLSKRVDYVGKNAGTIKKQLVDAERKRNALLLAQDPEHQDEAALPLAEIMEELDDSGNVVSSKIELPGSKVDKVVEAIEKVGAGGVKEVNELLSKAKPSSPVRDEDDDDEMVEDADTGSVPSPKDDSVKPPYNQLDTPDEARLRQEMHEYQAMDEVGAIVAELDMAEGSSDVSYDPDDDDMILGSDFDYEFDEDDDESEDDTGKAKHPVISDAYKRKMQELEEKLGLKNLTNLGPDPDLPSNVKKELDRPSAAEAARKAAIAREEKSRQKLAVEDDKDAKKSSLKTSGTTAEKKPKKKSVAFSEAIDIAKEAPPPPNQTLVSRAKPVSQIISKPDPSPLNDTVIERSANDEVSAAPAPAPAEKTSRFKQARQSQPSKSASEDRPLVAPKVLERPEVNDPTLNLPPDPAAIDDEMHRREIALEYHKMRNRHIRNQGGFVEHYDEDGELEDFDDDMQYTLTDPKTGEVKRVSRFKAARLRG
jgi:unconventional prefoldin RPB5 interactor 1